MGDSGGLVRLNVGGQWFTTTTATLTAHPGTLLTKMLERGPQQPSNGKTEGGYYFIDRDGDLFRHVLDFLRSSELVVGGDAVLRARLAAEARFYRLDALVQQLEARPGRLPAYAEVIETAHPEKIGVCSSRLVLTQELREQLPFCDVIEQLPAGHDEYHGAVGRCWVRTNTSRLDWASLLSAHGWTLVSTTSFCRRLPDITGQGTDLCHMVDKWRRDV